MQSIQAERFVLIVDDSAEDREVFRRLLSKDTRYKYEFVESDTGIDGINRFREHRPDCVLLDYHLPDLDGLEFLAYLVPQWSSAVALIMVTGQGNERVAVEAMRSGAQDYLVKDEISEDLLWRTVDNAIEKAALKQELARRNAELEEFVYIASHDMKALLRRIASFCHLLKDEYWDRIGPQADSYIDRTVSSANQLTVLVDDLLKYSSVREPDKAHGRVNLNLVMQEVRIRLSRQIEETVARLDVENLPTVMGNQEDLTQLFESVVHNALKFSGDRAPVIKVRAKEVDRLWQIDVTDRGIGIPPEHVQEIFEPFKRLNSRATYPGTGIGLSLARTVVRQHGGQIWLDSVLGRGSAVHFTLRKANTEQDESPTPLASSA